MSTDKDDNMAQIAAQVRLRNDQAAETAAQEAEMAHRPRVAAHLAFALLHAALASAHIELVRKAIQVDLIAYESHLALCCPPRNALCNFKLSQTEIVGTLFVKGADEQEQRTWKPPVGTDLMTIQAWATRIAAEMVAFVTAPPR